MAIQANTPSAYRSATSWNYLNSNSLPEGLAKPQVGSKMVRRYGTQSLTGLMEELGLTERVESIIFNHYEEDFIHDVIKVNASATHSAGAAVELTVQSDYRQSISETNAPYIATGSSSATLPRVHDMLEFEDGTTGLVTAAVAGANTFTVIPTISGESIPDVTISSVIINTGRANVEGGSTPDGVQTSLLSYTNNTMILDDAYVVYEGGAAAITWLDNLGESGNESYWYLEGIQNTKTRFENFCEMSAMTGKKITNTTLANTSGFQTAKITEGFIPFIENYGNVENYVSGSWGITDLDNMVTELNKYKASEENMFLAGLPLRRQVDTILRGSAGLTAGGIIYSTLPEEKAANLGFKSFTKDGYTFHLKRYDVFTDVKTLGASDNFKYPNLGIIAPLDEASLPDPKGGTTSVPSFSIAYNDVNGMESMGYKEWVTGGLGDANTDDTDQMKINFRKRFAFHGRGANRFGLFKAS